MTVAGSGMYVLSVILPTLQAQFGIDRASASLPFTLTMLGFGVGGVFMGKLADRYGIVPPLVISAFSLCLGFCLASRATSIWEFALIHGILIGFWGISAIFAPPIADISHWFGRRRGIAVAICASGAYLAGAICPNTFRPRSGGARLTSGLAGAACSRCYRCHDCSAFAWDLLCRHRPFLRRIPVRHFHFH